MLVSSRSSNSCPSVRVARRLCRLKDMELLDTLSYSASFYELRVDANSAEIPALEHNLLEVMKLGKVGANCENYFEYDQDLF